MRKVRVNFVGMVDYFNFFRSYEALERLGMTTSHRFDEGGVGWFILNTNHPDKLIDKTLHLELPEVYVAIQEVMENDNANTKSNRI